MRVSEWQTKGKPCRGAVSAPTADMPIQGAETAPPTIKFLPTTSPNSTTSTNDSHDPPLDCLAPNIVASPPVDRTLESSLLKPNNAPQTTPSNQNGTNPPAAPETHASAS